MNPLGNIGGPRRGPGCPRCHVTPCCCQKRPANPLDVVLCPRCHVSPCRCSSALSPFGCPRCKCYPCRCPREAPCVPCDPPFDEFACCPQGYQVGDILTLVGGTFTTVATFTVLTINAETGSVLTVSVLNGGNYAAFPALPAATTGGQGRGCTLNLTTGATDVTAATVAAGGGPWPKGYRVGDVCQLEGGTFTGAASVVVTASNGGGQVTGIAIRTAGSGYTVLPCSPATTFGGHGCGLKVTATFVGGVMTAAAIADMGGPCFVPAKKWWQITEFNIWGPGSGPPATPRSVVCGKMLDPFEKCWDALFDFCNGNDRSRPVTRLWLPTGTDVNGECCDLPGDVMEIPAKSGRLYTVMYVEYLDLDEFKCRCVGPCCCVGERLLVVVKQQCPLTPVPPLPPGDYLVSDSGAFVLTSDPNHWLTPA